MASAGLGVGSPNIAAEDSPWKGLFTSQVMPDRFRNSDNGGKLCYLTRGLTRFLNVVHTNFQKSETVTNTRVTKTKEIMELDRMFEVVQASQDTNHQTFGVSNDQGQQLIEDEVLFNSNLFARPQFERGYITTGLNGAEVGPSYNFDHGARTQSIDFIRTPDANNDYFCLPEQMKITKVGEKDSGGAGITLITVERVYNAPASNDTEGLLIPRNIVYGAIQGDVNTNAANANAPFRVGDKLGLGLPSYFEGTGAPEGLTKTPTMDVNFIQEYKYAYAHTTESALESGNYSYDPKDLRRWLILRRNNLALEKSYLFGQKGHAVDSKGRVLYMMGGVLQHIPQDADHQIVHTSQNLDYSSIQHIGEGVFGLGGSEVRHGFISYELLTRLKIAFADNDRLRLDTEESKRYKVDVHALEVTGGTIYLHPTYSFREMGFTNRMICLDLSMNPYTPVVVKGWDAKVSTITQPNGEQVEKEQIISMRGLRRKYAQYQSVVHF